MILAEAVAIGLVLSLYFADLLGFVAGGLVVPGYIAVIVDRPMLLLGTVLVALASLLLLKIFSRYAFIYGRRRLVLAVLLGFVLGQLSRAIADIGPVSQLQAFGFIIPGIITYWMETQGIVETLSMTIILAVIIRFALLLLHGGAPLLV
ncbi:poly-gamma-glutamate biosynthesis protein PgsC [Candidatus Acetothermia bacterium]|nr:poly-gamma-glutamate biosynthesis protein PgsC [Candidatus Acetothermia bacterium]